MKKLFVSWVGLFFLIFVFAPLAFAGGSPLAVAAAGVLQTFVFPLLTALLMGLVSWAVVKIGKKYHLDIVLNNEKLIESAALKGISYAEEEAADKLKASNIRLTSSDKLNLAVAEVLQAFPKLTDVQAAEYVRSVLGRITGAGATGAAAVRVSAPAPADAEKSKTAQAPAR